WIKTKSYKLKTFVSNRVAEIQTLSKDCYWKHVSSKNNPAELISRGCNVDEPLKNEMWFSDPDLQTGEYEDNQLLLTEEPCNKDKYLSADELKKSAEFLARIVHLSEFKAEIDALKKDKGVSKTKKEEMSSHQSCFQNRLNICFALRCEGKIRGLFGEYNDPSGHSAPRASKLTSIVKQFSSNEATVRYEIIHGEFKFLKVFVRWVLRMLAAAINRLGFETL
ncbi:uncharacterized protein TNCV_1067011, partial [Trichonephila clavipes]